MSVSNKVINNVREKEEDINNIIITIRRADGNALEVRSPKDRGQTRRL